MRFLLLLLPLLALGCDAFGADDFFESEYLSVYEITATNDDGTTTTGRIGLTVIPSDVASVPSVWQGLFDLSARADLPAIQGGVSGRGSIRGETLVIGFTGPHIHLEFFSDIPRGASPTESLSYFLSGTLLPNGQFVGTWFTRGGFTGDTVETGPFTGTRVREATQFYVAG